MEDKEEVAGTPPAEGEAPQVDPAITQEALEYGWVPQDQWDGEPSHWVSAERFVQRGREINHVLSKSLTRERAKTKKLEGDISELRQTVQGLAEYRQKLEKNIYQQAIRDLRGQLAAARSEGDFERAAALEGQMDTLKEQEPKEAAQGAGAQPSSNQPTPQQQALVSALQQWAPQNTWYNKQANPQMVRYADGVAADLVQQARAQGMDPDPTDILLQVTSEVRKMFPNKFGAASTPMFDSGGRGSGPTSQSRTPGFSSLPAEARKEFDRFYASGYYGTMKKEDAQAEYFNVYNEG